MGLPVKVVKPRKLELPNNWNRLGALNPVPKLAVSLVPCCRSR